MLINNFGIRNMGNSCYFNSALQSLLSIDCLYEFLLRNEEKNENEERSDVTKNFINIFKVSRDASFASKLIIPKTLHESLCNKYKTDFFKSHCQQDSHEFYLIFLDILEEYFGKKLDIFYGSYDVKLSCDCSKKNIITEEFTSLCLPGVFKEEVIEDYQCDQCLKKGLTKKSFDIKNLPSVLTIQVNRFGKSMRKNISPFIFEEVMYKFYNLNSIVLHSGYSIESGHYYNVSKRNGEWVCFNDGAMTPFDIKTIDKTEIYMLFYTKETTKN